MKMQFVLAQPCPHCEKEGKSKDKQLSYLYDEDGVMTFESKAQARDFIKEVITWEAHKDDMETVEEFVAYRNSIMIIPELEVIDRKGRK